jgi:dienelactone hydrolase
MPSTSASHPPSPVGASVVDEGALALGPRGALVGILARPTPAAPARLPAVVFLNAGVLHRVGPHRLHVVLARRLARAGRASLRFDLSGIGDSPPVPDALTFRASAVADVRAALDDLERALEVRRFVLFGLCSGADNALAAAVADPRVVGLVLLDPPTYVTPRARARRWIARVRQIGGRGDSAPGGLPAMVRRGSAAVVRRARARVVAALGARGRWRSADAAVGAAHANADAPVGGREMPPIADYRAQLAALTGRGIAILAVFSGALGERYNHADQLFELFPELRGAIEPAYFPAANHMFTERAAQAALCARVETWLERNAR